MDFTFKILLNIMFTHCMNCIYIKTSKVVRYPKAAKKKKNCIHKIIISLVIGVGSLDEMILAITNNKINACKYTTKIVVYQFHWLNQFNQNRILGFCYWYKSFQKSVCRLFYTKWQFIVLSNNISYVLYYFSRIIWFHFIILSFFIGLGGLEKKFSSHK